ncbi:receptor-like protein kinase FERONIA [Fagus crenata]
MEAVSKLFRFGKRAKQSSALPEEICRRFLLAEIKIATNNFYREFLIGEGSFGKVYKGCIDDRTINVAIKRLSFGMESKVVSTLGYADPEYVESGQLTDKSDIYSFGVKILVNWARKCKREGTINHIIDPYLTGKIAPECFKIFMDIVTSCVRTKGTERPTIGEVEVGLEHALVLQESADLDPGIGSGDQYMYPILEYTGTDSPLEED